MKILIADDHALFREGLALNLEELSENVEIKQAENYKQASEFLIKEPQPDLVIVDLDMPDQSWQDGLSMLQQQASKSLFVIMSATENIATIKKILSMGVKGYIPKRSDSKIILAALKLIMEGGIYIPPQLLAQEEIKSKTASVKRYLTARQKEVLQYIAQGLSNKQIAHEMGVSEATVKLHINAMLKYLQATNRTQALVNAQKMNLL